MNKSILTPLAKLNFLIENYDEELLHNNGLVENLRCKSRVQTYHILESLEYRSTCQNSYFEFGAAYGTPEID